ncbi:MAG TPA: SusC/RagA family protein [Porphyromonadaceae bacterium]|nr:SusC/RagA family protein [Porphyromonadaceae bacterium]
MDLLEGTGCTFAIQGNHIVISKVPVIAQQQGERTVTGIVTDENRDPIIGANIVEKGTNNGTISDIDGNFTLSVNNNATLHFSYIGYLAQDIVIADKTSFQIVLLEDTHSLDELVVIGYGTMRKRDLTGSIVQIRPDRIANENPNTVQDILRGTAGLQVGYVTSAKGGGSMQLRGQRSVYTAGGHNEPLIILDGMMFYGELSEINPSDIEQIDILKDASAAAIYGAKAASGVIIITTKKGKQGKPLVNVTSNIGVMKWAEGRKTFEPEEYMKHREDWYKSFTYGTNPTTGAYEAYQTGSTPIAYYDHPSNLGIYGVSPEQWRTYTTNADGESDASIYARRLLLIEDILNNYLAGKSTDWFKEYYQTGFNQDYNVSVAGASDKMNYYMSVGYLNNEGVITGDEYQAVHSNLKVEGEVNKWLTIGANINFQDRSDGSIQPNQLMERNSPYANFRDENGEIIRYPTGPNSKFGDRSLFDNQFKNLERGYTIFNSIINAKVKLPFDITYSFNASPRYQFYYNRYHESSQHPDWAASTNGRVQRGQTKRFDWSLNNTIQWNHVFSQRHHVNLTLVQEAEEFQGWSDHIDTQNILPSDALGFHYISSGEKARTSFSSNDNRQTADALLARLFYSYDERYMITTSIRRDGYSAFGQYNPYATFPSIALAWSFIDESFFQWKPMSTGKLRVSWGKNGNRSLSDPYISFANLTSGAMQGYIDASGKLYNISYLRLGRMANPNLQWEKTTAMNFGLDIGFLDNRITGNIEYYVMNTHDMIMNQRLPDFSGFSSITTNLGEVSNRGVEIFINSNNIRNSVLEWNTSLSFSYNKNRIKHLYYEYEDILDNENNVIGQREMDDRTNGWFIGKPISAIWNYRVTGIWQIDEIEEAKRHGQKPGDPKVANIFTADDRVNPDDSTTPVYNDNDREFLGQTAPPILWSLRNDFTFFKNLSLSFNIYSQTGHKILSTNYLNQDNNVNMVTQNWNLYTHEYWTPDNPINKYGRLNAQGPAGLFAPSKIYSRTFIRLENISIGYTLPKEWIQNIAAENVKLYGSVKNVAVWKKDWVYGDPETGNMTPRIFSVGLNITL